MDASVFSFRPSSASTFLAALLAGFSYFASVANWANLEDGAVLEGGMANFPNFTGIP
jgi:hypothetical protein